LDNEFEKALKEIGITNTYTVYYKMMDQSFWRSIIKITLSIYAFFKIWRYVQKNRINTIYSNTSINIYGIIIAKITGKKHIWHFNEQPYEKNNYVHPAFFGLYRYLLKYSKNIVVFISNMQKVAWETMLQTSVINNYQVVYNPLKKIHHKDLNTKNYDFSFGYLGGFTEIPKNVLSLLDCFKQFVADHPNIRLQLILKGKGPLENFIRKKIISDSLENNVKIESYSRELSTFFSLINVIVLPSYYESWGLVVLEAISVGKRAIVTKYTAVHEIIPNGYCLYFDPYDTSSLYDAMKEIFTKPALTPSEVETFNRIMTDNNNRFHQTIKELCLQ